MEITPDQIEYFVRKYMSYDIIVSFQINPLNWKLAKMSYPGCFSFVLLFIEITFFWRVPSEHTEDEIGILPDDFNLDNVSLYTKEKALTLFEKHWKNATGKDLDETTKHHMQYCIDAIEEALKTS